MSVHIWTEALGCAEILQPMLKSYCQHHEDPIYVYIYDDEIHHIYKHKLVIPVLINDSNSFVSKSDLKMAYKFGHKGTALLWASILESNSNNLFIHLDSDTIFLGDVVGPILQKLNLGYGVVGTRRPYRLKQYRTNFYADMVHKIMPDAVNTHCFGFNNSKIRMNREQLSKFILGQSTNKLMQRLFPVVDFFDRLTFILRRKNGIYYLDSNHQKRSGSHNRDGQVESSMISFAAVGSGCSFWKNPQINTSESYKDFAIKSFALYSHYLLGETINFPQLDSPYLESKLKSLDKATWTIRNI